MYVCGDTVHHASTLDAAVVVDKGQQYHVNYEFCSSKLTEHEKLSREGDTSSKETSTISADLLFVHPCRSLIVPAKLLYILWLKTGKSYGGIPNLYVVDSFDGWSHWSRANNLRSSCTSMKVHSVCTQR